ncbi:iron-sulfur protein [Streptomyces sp. TRM43335]|uniref:Iron-sulfur protein n=1 Tax=Streptomyces taklimakanensis TaxID=2569853 RepID=A0A6G2BHE5_9ACTN|nr:(2Fe-2S)-binding protein [Streptomyces taklimakanensis]MTE21546.1 iron-sulfur protein [Streptomyces taklimakanensis]
MSTLAPAPTASTASTGSPFSAAYGRLAEVFPALRVLEVAPGDALPHGGGWVRAEELAGGGAPLDAFLAWDDEQTLRDHGERARPDVIASFGLHRYAWSACLLMTLPWFLHRRVPRVPAGAVAFDRASGRLAVRVEEFSCLPNDASATRPGARVVSDEEELRAAVREAVAEHIGPVLEGFRPRMRRGPRALWGMVTDEITEGLWYIGHLLGEERRAMAEAELLLPGSVAPYPAGAGFRELSGPNGETYSTRDRASCCLFYTLRPQDTCITCPRTCDADRIERLTGTSA